MVLAIAGLFSFDCVTFKSHGLSLTKYGGLDSNGSCRCALYLQVTVHPIVFLFRCFSV